MRKLALIVLLFIFGIIPIKVWSAELMSTADLMGAESWRLSVYGISAETEPILDVEGGSGIQVPLAGGGNQTLFSNSSSEVEMEAEYSAAVVAVTIRPGDGLHFRFKAGQVQDYDLSYSSGSLINEFQSLGQGLVWGAGLRWNISQNTMVSSALSLDVSFTKTMVTFDRFESGGTVSNVNQKFSQDEFQAALTVSHQWKKVEPFAGLKLNHVRSRLKDKETKQKLIGTKDGFSPFVGLAWDVFRNEEIIFEASFLDEKAFSAGFNINF